MAVSLPTIIASWASGTNVTTSTGTLATGAAAGDVVFVTAHAGSATATITVSDSKGNTWQSSDHSSTTDSPASTTRVFWSCLTTALTSGDTITVDRGSVGGLAWTASKVSGASGLLGTTTTLAGTGNTITTVHPTPTAGSLCVMVYTSRDGVQLSSVDNGYTASQIVTATGAGNPRGGGYIYQPITTETTTSTPSLKMETSQGWSAIFIELLPTDTPAQGLTEPTLFEWDGTTMTKLDLVEWDGTTMTPLHLWHPAKAVTTTLAIIGDSNTYRDGPPPFGSREATTISRLVTAGWQQENIYWHGVGGKQMMTADTSGTTTLQNIAAAVTALGSVDQLVIALGTNDTPLDDASFIADMNTVLDHCETLGVKQVLWVNLAYKSANNTNSNHFNPIISSTIAARTNMSVADWHTYIHTTSYSADDWIVEDGTHYTVQGYAKRDQFIINSLLSLTPPTDPAPPAEQLPFMGGYLGTPGETPDERYLSAFGAYPAVASTYYQGYGNGGGANINLAYEQARSARGTIPLITVTSVGGAYSMAEIGNGTADAWIDYWRDNIAQIDGEVWFTFDHEFEVKLNQNKWGAAAPTIAEYVTAYNRFVSRVKAGAPNVKSVYWYGYSDTAKISQIGSQITPPDLISFDPYVFSHHDGTTTFTEMAEPKMVWLRSQSWYSGQPIFLSEYGIDSIHGDAQMASFYTNLRPDMQALGIAGGLIFSRDRVDDIMADISNDNWPLAKAAYRASQLDT